MSNDWWIDAACQGIPTEMFFPEKGQSSGSSEVKQLLSLCENCAVKDVCLDAALRMEGDCGRNMRHGIWGGTLPEQRHRLVKGLRVSRPRNDNLCYKGLHEMTPDNVYVYPASQYRECRACRSIIRQRNRSKRAS